MKPQFQTLKSGQFICYKTGQFYLLLTPSFFAKSSALKCVYRFSICKEARAAELDARPIKIMIDPRLATYTSALELHLVEVGDKAATAEIPGERFGKASNALYSLGVGAERERLICLDLRPGLKKDDCDLVLILDNQALEARERTGIDLYTTSQDRVARDAERKRQVEMLRNNEAPPGQAIEAEQEQAVAVKATPEVSKEGVYWEESEPEIDDEMDFGL
ncbi:MAG: hypothetical protein K2P57_02660 [Burkholderiales bacterium]|nr:hypothetical protein [Burkholderiales bacterium]